MDKSKKMNRFKILLIPVLLVITGLAGCADFLDIVPDERPTEEDAFQDRFAAEDFLYSCYAPIPNLRNSVSSIDFMTSDEVVTAFEHETFAHFPRGNYTASSPVISYWNDLYRGIRQSWILINNVDLTPGLSEELKREYKAEARFLIGYYHFLLARMYGPIIIQRDVADVDIPYSEYPGRSTFDETVDFIVDILDEAATDLPERRTATDYGRATSTIAKALKARLLLYAASPLFNGGGPEMSSFYQNFTDDQGQQLISTSYDREKWARAVDAAKEAIDLAESVGHVLYTNSAVSSALPADPVEKDLRFTFVDKNSNEIIWAETRPEGVYMFQNKSTPYLGGSSWNGVAPTLAMLELFYTENGLPIDVDPDFDYQNRYDIANGPLGTTLALNLNREPRFNAWIAYHNSYYEIERNGQDQIVAQFRKDDGQGIQNRSNNYSPTGYLNKKGVHPQLNQNTLQVSEQYPWPKIRLAELYLNYAEALIEYGEDFATAKEYIDRVRERAGIPSIDEAWAVVGGADDQETLRRIVRQERSVEFYLENHRFWDLRRWMIAEEHLDSQPYGMNIHGVTDNEFFRVTEVVFPRRFNSPAHYLMPIPIQEINTNPSLVQNPGY